MLLVMVISSANQRKGTLLRLPSSVLNSSDYIVSVNNNSGDSI